MAGVNKKDAFLTTWEWLTVIGIICSTGVSVTVYAFTHFEQKDDAEKRELRLNEGIKELRENQKIFMESMGLKYKPLNP